MDFIFGKKVETERIVYTESKIDLPIAPPPPTQQSAPVVNFVMPPIPILDEGKVPVSTPAPVSAVVPMVMKSMLSPAPLPVQVGNSNFSPNTETYPSIGTSYFITDAQVNADVAKWATYPAVTTIDVGGFDIVNVSTITTTNLVSDNIDTKQIDTASGLNGGFVNTSKVQLQRMGTNPGQIQMYDNNNVPHILESVNSNLYFDNQLLAKAGDIQDIADWALYPASADVDLVGQKLKGASEVQLGSLVLTDNAGILDVNGQPVSANWSSYVATQDVDLATKDITNVGKINGSAYVATKDWSTQVAVGNVDLANNNILNVTDINGSPYPPTIPNWSTIPASQDVDIANFNIVNVVDINGSPYPPVVPNWSTIPATQDVDLANFDILNVTNINGSPYPPAGASQWSTFQAVSDVSIPDHNLTLTSAVPNPNPGLPYKTCTIKGNLTIGDVGQGGVRPDFNSSVGSFNIGSIASPATSVNVTAVGNVAITGGAGVSISGGGGVSVSGIGGVSVVGVGNLSLAGGDVQVTGAGIVSVGAGGVLIGGGGGVAVTGGGGVLVTAGAGVSVAGGAGVAVTGGGGVAVTGGAGVQITSGGGLKTELIGNTTGIGNTLDISNVNTINGSAYPPPSSGGVTSLNTEVGAITITSPTANLVVGSTGVGNIELSVPGGALSSFLSLYSIYVAPNGNDTTGTGSANNPYLTIGRAITARALISNTIEVSIQLFPGTYSPASLGIVLTQNTFLVGIPVGEITQPVNIVAQVSLQAGTGTVGLYGLNLFPASSQCVVINVVGTYNINNCNIFNTTNYAIAQSLGTLYLTESRITSPTSGTFPGIGVIGNTASLIMRDCLLTSSGTPSMVSCIGNLTMRQCVLINTSTSTLVNPLVNFNPTIAGNSCEISYSTLQYTSAVSALNKICVRANPTAGINAAFVNFVFNLLLCEGAQSGTAPNNYHCIDRVSAGGPATISYGNLLAGASAHQIDSTITKTQYNSVP